MRNRALLAVLFLLLGGGSYLYRAYTRSPKYSLIQAFRTVGEHDLSGFEQYVDVEGVVGGMIDQGLELAMKEAGSAMPGGFGFPGAPGMEPLGMGMGGAVGKGLVGMIKPALMKAAKTQVASFIEKGDFDGLAGGEVPSAAAMGAGLELQKLFSGSGEGKDVFRGIAYTKKHGKVAVVGLAFQLPGYDTAIVVDLRMRDRGEYWQVFDISNFVEVVKKFDELEAKRVERLNAPVREAIAAALVFKGFKKTDEPASGGRYSKRVTFTLDYQNTGNKPIESFKANITCRAAKGDILLEFPVSRGSPIAPGGLGILVEKKDLLTMMPQHAELYVLGAEHLKIDSAISFIRFSDGSELKYHKKKTDPRGFLGGY